MVIYVRGKNARITMGAYAARMATPAAKSMNRAPVMA
jgi:hypothetical protein